MKTRLKSIFFDLDDTLYQEHVHKQDAEMIVTRHIARQLGIPHLEAFRQFRAEKARVLAENSTSPFYTDRVKWFGYMPNSQELADMYWAAVYENLLPYRDFVEVAPELSGKYDIYILSDELREIAERKLEKIGIGHFFKRMFTSDEIGVSKPSREIFEYALSAAGRLPEEAIMVGDNPSRDIAGARGAGLGTAWIRRGKYYCRACEADIIFENYVTLPDALENFQKNA